VRGGFVEAVRLERVDVGTVGGPMPLIDFSYGEGDTGQHPPTVTSPSAAQPSADRLRLGCTRGGSPGILG
jgi:hypothetical protein